ncbi:MAG TPA: hypothetical protein C5S37_13725, partial [Methanophagales archaeon]|nr:hypothetical protein [Methanophagales archaeon]
MGCVEVRRIWKTQSKRKTMELFYLQEDISNCKNIGGRYLYPRGYLKVRRQKMCKKFQLKGGICEVNFRYNAKM